MQISVDLFSLKVFALLMCKGTVRDKAVHLFNLIEGGHSGGLKDSTKEKEPSVTWNSGRMKQAFKKLIFFAEIFPKKYQNQFLHELLKL